MAERRGRTRKKRKRDGLGALFEPYVWAWFEKTFGEASPPQVAAWPRIAEGQNTLIFSPTGSGKTLAAFLWCMNELYRMGREGTLDDAIHVLYVSPLKALNNDIQKNLVEPLAGIAKAAKRARVDAPEVRSAVRTGDTTQQERAAMARKPPHIFITTPESLFIILSTQKFRRAFRQVRYVIVDEIHAMSDNKRGVHLSLSLERLAYWVGHDFVRIGCSATQKPLDEIARFLVGIGDDGEPRPCAIVDTGMRKRLNVQVVTPVDNLLEAHFDAIWGSAYARLIDLIADHDTTLVFTQSRHKTERTALRLNELSVEAPVRVGAHHGSMSKEVRLEMEDRLKAGKLDALVATSSLELGIDVGSIDLVCQIESPKSVSRGMQRIGRAGHLLGATSEGRLLVTDRDDLVESAVLVKAILDGELDTTRVPENCLDVLAQHIVGAVAADDWDADELFGMVRRSWCFRRLDRRDYDRVLEMLCGYYPFAMEREPFPKIAWDQVNNVLSPERAARMIAFRASGTIPDVADYEVWLDAKSTKVGQLDEGFVEDLRTGDIFILGSTAWRVLGIRRNRVHVEDVYGLAPTIPHWGAARDSRTADLGRLVGRFRRTLAERMADGENPIPWLRRKLRVDPNGARSIYEYFREQRAVAADVPSDRLVLVEQFRNELGQQQIVIHSSFGIRVNDTWAMALCRAIDDEHGFRPTDATVDDGILLTVPPGRTLDAERLLGLVTPGNLDALLARAVRRSAVFASRFRHCAVRALLVLREYRGRRTPVWLQSLRAGALLEACRDCDDFPLVVETLRECLHEALDAPSLKSVLAAVASGEIATRAIETEIPSPFTHSLLLLGQYGEVGSIPTRERRSRLMHLHRELLRQILDEETLANLLDEDAVAQVEAELQHTAPRRRARDANELARVLRELGDLVAAPDDEISLLDRADGDPRALLAELVAARRALSVPIPSAETRAERWIATESFALYRAAFAARVRRNATDRKVLDALKRKGPCTEEGLRLRGDVEASLERLVAAYQVLRFPSAIPTRHPERSEAKSRDLSSGRSKGGRSCSAATPPSEARRLADEPPKRDPSARPDRLGRDDRGGSAGAAVYAATEGWVPAKLRRGTLGREEARRELVARFLRRRGPVTQYDVMERYGFPEPFVEDALGALHEAGSIARGEYVPTKAFPQWCHRLTLLRLRKEMEPATPEEFCDFLLRWQHVHPETRVAGLNGLRAVIGQLEGHENYQALFERDIFPSRIRGYDPALLDRLCYGGEVLWRRFGHKDLKRGQIGFCLRADQEWLVVDPGAVGTAQWDGDIGDACDAVRGLLTEHGPCFFDDVVQGTGLERRIALRVVWHLVWTGEATTDSYESVRHANVTSGLSACYDLSTRLGPEPTDHDAIARRMLGSRKLDPTLGRWAPTERLVPPAPEAPEAAQRAWAWARLLLARWGIVCRDTLKREVSAPSWRGLRRALARMELLGQVRRGFFVQEVAGEQYALPEAVDALRDAKLRRPRADRDDEPMILLNACEPANPFSRLFPLVNEAGEKVRFARNPHNYMVVQCGQPVLLYQPGRIALLVDLSRERAEAALRALMQLIDHPPKVESCRDIHVRDWNGHPSDVSPARHLLAGLGFVLAEAKGRPWVYDGTRPPAAATLARAEKDMPEVFERAGKERAPATYDADWLVSRSPRKVRAKLRELLDLLGKALPDRFALTFGPRNFSVLYREVSCVNPHIGHKRIRLGMGWQGIDAWCHGFYIDPDTDLAAPELTSELLASFERARRGIDARLGRQRRPGATGRARGAEHLP